MGGRLGGFLPEPEEKRVGSSLIFYKNSYKNHEIAKIR